MLTKMWEQEFMKYLKENNIELDNTISEEVTLDNGMLPKGFYKLVQILRLTQRM